jgi:hypothetical protein
MPNRKSKAQGRAEKRAKAQRDERSAQKAGLAAMQAKLLAGAQAADRGEAPKVLEQLPQLSKRKQRTLKNRTKI